MLFPAAATTSTGRSTASAIEAPTATPTGNGTAARSAAIAKAVDDAVARYDLPGIAVGVVVDGQVVQLEVRGERVAGSGEAIDAQTLFKVASNTKAMTAALLARLVDAGRLAWDDPVVKHLPHFRMYDPWVTREIQVRDLLIHNSGLGAGAGDLMLWPEPNAFTRADVIAGLAHLKPKYGFRSRYAYDNTLYVVAGEVAAAAGGAPYATLLQREVFAPLGMSGCRVGAWARAETPNLAQPHGRVGGRNGVIRADGERIDEAPMAAAGGVRCPLADMLTWVRAWLHADTPAQVAGAGAGAGALRAPVPWLSAAQREAMWTAHTPMPLSARMRAWDDSHFSAYGYGWRLTDVDGTHKVSHTGTLAGMYSAVTLLPQRNAGIVVLINGEADEPRTVLTQVLTKQFTDPGSRLDVAHYAGLLAKERGAAGAAVVPGQANVPPLMQPPRHPGHPGPSTSVEPTDVAASPPAAPVEPRALRALAASGQAFLGIYRDPWFGEASICPDAGGVRFRAAKSPKLGGRVLEADGRLLVDWDDPGVDAEAWLHFSGGGDTGAPQRLAMSKVDPDADFSYDYEDLAFVRVADCAADQLRTR